MCLFHFIRYQFGYFILIFPSQLCTDIHKNIKILFDIVPQIHKLYSQTNIIYQNVAFMGQKGDLYYT